MLGIVKAYTTRVGAGPFPCELDDEVADLLVERGHEYGTNTGRRRRPGWLDLVMVRHAVRINSCSELALTKLDVLSPLPELKVCVAYEGPDGERYDHLPYHQTTLHKVTPIYETLPGWGVEIDAVSDFADLPTAAQDYVRFIADVTRCPVTLVGVGADRRQTVDVPSAA